MDIHKLPLTLSPRPEPDDIPALAKEYDIFLTLLMDQENPEEIGQAVEKGGRVWWHCRFSVLPRNQGKYDFNLVVATVEKLCQALIDKKRVFIHCDAGIVRTGIVTLAALLCLGFKKRQAVKFLISKEPKAASRLDWDYVNRLVNAVQEARRKLGVDPDYHPTLARAYSLVNNNSYLLTRNELASLIRSSPRIVKQWLWKGIIPSIKEGRLWRIKNEDLSQFRKSKIYLDYLVEYGFFPWVHVNASRADANLQSRHSLEQGKNRYLAKARSCPKCDTPPDHLTWIYFRSPEGTWGKCGRAGWLIVCDQCHIQTDFFLELMS